MDPLTQDQVQAIERAALDVDALIDAERIHRERRAVVDWSLWEAVVVQGIPARQVARAVVLGRKQVRGALRRVHHELTEGERGDRQRRAGLFDVDVVDERPTDRR